MVRVNSISFRLGISRLWYNFTFIDFIYYSNYIFENFWFLCLLNGIFYKLGINFYSKSLIKRRENMVLFVNQYSNTHVTKPLIKTTKRFKKLKIKNLNFLLNKNKIYNKFLQQIFLKGCFYIFGKNMKFYLYFRRLLKWSIFGDSKLLCLFIEKKIKQNFSSKYLFIKLLNYYKCNTIKSNKKTIFFIKGIKLSANGQQSNKIGRSITFSMQKGIIYYQTAVETLDYSSKVVISKFGCINIQIWLNYK